MIEQPYLRPCAFTSKENILELLRRCKHQYFDKFNNPRNRFFVTKQQYQSYFKFSIVRNPWSRVVSWYENVIRDEIHLKRYGIPKEISFRDFLFLFAGKGMLKPQLYWLKSFDGTIPLNYIGRFENLHEDMQEVFDWLGMKEANLPHMIKGSGVDYKKYYNYDTINLVSDVYRGDIQTFGYRFE